MKLPHHLHALPLPCLAERGLLLGVSRNPQRLPILGKLPLRVGRLAHRATMGRTRTPEQWINP